MMMSFAFLRSEPVRTNSSIVSSRFQSNLRIVIRAIDRCGTLAQNDSSIAVGIIIDGKAERIAEVAQLKIVVSADVVDGKTVHSLSVDQNGLLADNSCFGLILPARKFAADRDIFFPGNDRNGIALCIERNGKAAVRLAQELRKIAPLSKKRSPSEQFFTLRVAYSIVCCNANFA